MQKLELTWKQKQRQSETNYGLLSAGQISNRVYAYRNWRLGLQAADYALERNLMWFIPPLIGPIINILIIGIDTAISELSPKI